MKKLLLLISLFLSVTLFAQNRVSTNSTIHLKILETGDVHGCIFPQDLVKQRTRKGSLAQVETFANGLRAEKNQTVILLDDGDILQGTPFVYYYNYVDTTGVHQLATVMNYMHYAAGTVGNHDIEPGHGVYDKFKKELDYPWMAANAVVDSTGKPYFQPYVILHRDGLKIAVLGMITPGIPNWLAPSIWSGMHFADMVKTARYWVKFIREKEHPDLMIGLFHSGTDSSYGSHDPGPTENASVLVAKEVPGFDIVFAGHDHKPSNQVVTNTAGNDVLVLDAGAHAELVSEANITMTYNPETHRYEKNISGHLRSMSGYKPDSAFMHKFMPDFVKVQKFVNRPIGKFTKGIDARNALFGPSAFVDIIHRLQLKDTHAEISIVSLLSMNARIDKGNFYMRDLFKLYRYENYLYTMKLSGREIKNILEYSYSLWFNTMRSKKDHLLLFKTNTGGNLVKSKWTGRPFLKNAYYNFNSAAGIKYIVDVSKKPGSRITILSMTNGKPFDMNKMYTVAINSYQGNGGGSTLTEGAGLSRKELAKRLISSSKKDIRYLMMQWIESQKELTPKALDDWKVIPEKWVKPAAKKDRELLFGK